MEKHASMHRLCLESLLFLRSLFPFSQAVLAGDAFLESALTGDEDLRMDLVYMAAA